MTRPYRTRGLTLVELMIAMTIGLILVGGAFKVFMDSSKTYGIHETEARLEENARYVYSVLEADLRMAGYWGYAKGVSGISGSTLQTDPAATTLAGTAASSCGTNFGTDLGTPIEGTSDGYGLSCSAYLGRPMPSADTLTVRRASMNTSSVAKSAIGPLRICSTRTNVTLVNAVTNCQADQTPAENSAGTIHDLLVHSYYVARDSAAAANTPTLWRKSLNNVGTVPTFQDEEILAGVEDFQVQFGIDYTGTTGLAQQYVNPVAAASLPTGAQVVAIRMWILVRGDTQEVGFTDNRVYTYGSRATQSGTTNDLTGTNTAGMAYQPNDHYRRLLVSRTVMIRNVLGT
jgi:type IV pilus assembly protein PilW